MVHIGLDKFEGLFLNHATSLAVHHGAQLLNHFATDTFPLFRGLIECMPDNLLHVVQSLDTLSKPEAEVTEPLVVESDRPILAEELDSVRNNVILVPLSQLIQVILMKSDETPQTLKDNLLMTHVGDRVNQADAIKRELDKVALTSRSVKPIADEITSILDFLFARLKNQRVCSLNMVVDDIIRQDTSLTLW